MPERLQHPHVPREHLRHEPFNTEFPCDHRQPGQEQSAQTQSLHPISDDEGDFGGRGVDKIEPPHPDDRAVDLRDERHPPLVVHLGEVVEVGIGQMGVCREEAQVDRPG